MTLPRDLIARLDAAAVAGERSRSFTARRILEQALADHVDLHRQAAEHFEEVLAGVAIAPAMKRGVAPSPRAPSDSPGRPPVESGGSGGATIRGGGGE